MRHTIVLHHMHLSLQVTVAEEMRKPLYSMSAGELGYSAGEVERRLHKVLELSTKWGAILLIDECDVFLEKRTTSNIERNKLVSGKLKFPLPSRASYFRVKLNTPLV